MAKAKTMEKSMENPLPLANPKGKTVDELKEVAITLQAQVTENQRLANHHQTLATKAQGALEVMLQMIPRQEVEEMINAEAEADDAKATD
tara:strand:+ start:33 stop:302 length:270 start_codon:yes stop_codon:yes gene_type:complete